MLSWVNSEVVNVIRSTLGFYFYSAAAYSQQGDYEKAVEDATKALEVDPKYSKGYSRLG